MGQDQPAPAAVPPGQRIYAIGDVHGCLDKLAALHEQIAADLAARPVEQPLLIHLGDYIDRGPDSAGVIRHLLRGFQGLPTVNLVGNHEAMMLAAVDRGTPESLDLWLRNGGRASLASWEVPADIEAEELRTQLPGEHVRFLRALAVSHAEGGYFFVHAGVRPGIPLNRQSDEDLTWIREPFLSWTGSFGAVVVHGHTPAEAPAVRSNRIGIDTGAVLGGPLTCLVLEADRLNFLFA